MLCAAVEVELSTVDADAGANKASEAGAARGPPTGSERGAGRLRASGDRGATIVLPTGPAARGLRERAETEVASMAMPDASCMRRFESELANYSGRFEHRG